MANVVITLFKPPGDHLCLVDRDVDILEGIVPIKKAMHYEIKQLLKINMLSVWSLPGRRRDAGT